MKRLTQGDILKSYLDVHGDKYDYSLVDYVNSRTKIKIICKEHGVFEQQAGSHKRGEGCPSCGKLIGRSKKTQEDFVKQCVKVHNGKYDYSLVKYKDALSEVAIICKEHGTFEQIANEHLKGKGCVKCSYEKRGFNKRIGEEALHKILIDVHEGKYEIDISQLKNYNNTQKEYINIVCKKHGVFKQKISNHMYGNGCPKCGVSVSKGEDEIYNFLKDYVKTYQRHRLENNKEVDLLIKELGIGIEYNGLRWHSDAFQKENSYHLQKTNYCKEQGIRLIHVFEDEWLFKKEIVKSRILNLIGKTPNKIYARNCEIKIVSSKESVEFLEQNHIQGSLLNSINLCLYHNGELTSLMNFSSLRRNMGSSKKDNVYELTRFCNKLNTTVVGGASKLLKYFERNFNPVEIISYADRRWSEGNMYHKLNFDFIHFSTPNYFYINRLTRENRFKYRKSELVKQGFDSSKTEKQIMQERGFSRIYDCGTIKFSKIYK